jgi:hypothetical protein
MKAIVLDAKGDTPWMLRHARVLSLDDLAFSLVACPAYATQTAFINRWLMLFRECFWTAELQSAVLLPIVRELLQRGMAVSLADVVGLVRLRDKSPAGKACADRLESTSLAYPNLYESKANRWDALHETSLYCPITGTLTPATRFVLWLVIIERFAYLQRQQHRDRGPHTAVFLDEAQTSLSKRTQTVSGLPSTPVQLLPTTREHGMQFIVATPSWTELDPLVLSQFQVQVALQPSDGRELDAIAKSFRLTPAMSRFAAGMQRGTAIGKIRGIEHPFLFTYQPFEQTKDIDEHTRAAARARAERFNTIASNTLAAREGNESNGQQAPPPPPAAAPSASHAVAAPLLKPETAHNTHNEEIPSNPTVSVPLALEESKTAPNGAQATAPTHAPRPRVALNKHATALLQDVADHPFTLCTKAYRRRGLLLAQGDRARAQLERLDLLRATRVTCGRGRGRSGIALSLRPDAWRVLGHKAAKGLRGGSGDQHSFCVFELSRCIPGSLIEEYFDGKPVDLAIPFNSDKHEPFYRAIAALTGETPHLDDGDIVAVEVEISDLRSVRNAVKNNAAGIALTILAIADRQPERLRLLLPHNTVVLDVYALMDVLRSTEVR